MPKTHAALLAAAITLGLTAPPAFAQEAEMQVFTRSGSWSLDAGEDSCRLARNFSNGDAQIALALERNRADNVARLVLVGDAIRPFRNADRIGYRFAPEEHERAAMYLRAETSEGEGWYNLGNVFIGPDPLAMMASGAEAPEAAPHAGEAFVVPPYNRGAEAAYAAGITAIELTDGLTTPLRLETGSLGAPIEALQACMDDLLGHWGLDWEKHRTLSRRAAPVGEAWEWIGSNVVGFRDFRQFAGGRNPFRVMIDAEGRPTSCTPHWPSLTERQNEQICEGIMQNGRFTPALDAEGQPIASYWMVDYMFGLARPFRR